MNLTLAITNHNRLEMLFESFTNVLNNEYIDEIIIMDDCSDRSIYEMIAECIEDYPRIYPNTTKIKLFRQPKNVGMSRNKRDAIAKASNEWVIIFDSDNVIDESYINAIPVILKPDTIYCPDFAKPNFDYRKFGNHIINIRNIPSYIHDKDFNMMLNTCNYLVHRDTYMEVYQENIYMKATDTKWFAYLWLKSGGSFKVMKNCSYFHRVHNESGFMADAAYNMTRDKELTEMIKTLK